AAVRVARAGAPDAPAGGGAWRGAGREAPPARATPVPGGARHGPAGAGPRPRQRGTAAGARALRPRGAARVPRVIEGEQRRLLRALRLPRDRRGADARRRADRLADVAGSVLKPQAVLFDNDGLLLDTEVLWTRAETDLFERHGLTFTIEHKRELIGTSGVVSEAI